jgi:hypothetical protein
MNWVIRAVRRGWDRPGERMHDLGYRRSWREDLEVSLDRKMFEIALYNNLVAWMGPGGEDHGHSEADARPIGWLLFQIRFAEWHWPHDEHIYYDGCHCSWRVGPFQLHRSNGHWCAKCAGEK